MNEIRRALLYVQVVPGERGRLDILFSGRVRLRVNDDPQRELTSDTIEDLLLDAAAWPALNAETYEQLHWELDMLALRGE